MTIPKELKYSKDHEWVKVEGGNRVRIGITHFAKEALGDVVFVELPAPEDSFSKGDSFGVVESVKAASDCYSPVSGTVVEVNENLQDSPEQLSQDPYGAGWMILLELSDESELDELLSAEAYAEFLKEEEGK
ncbi:glycine cleavage system protein GcvH [Desulfolucanica intricata]|uniref:glycine cleavage system protein GcvH n=1 Tax=Desulfolucanica intricata TaxID=1285191 RepID=UPI0008341CD5|nr:glycine cleavage system protein GcvH [Desulfolucanica intricata]